jgi:hypothetical protein
LFLDLKKSLKSQSLQYYQLSQTGFRTAFCKLRCRMSK